MAELTEKYGRDKVEAQIIPGERGIFDVLLDGERIYCKHETKRFPAYGEIPMAIDMKLISRG